MKNTTEVSAHVLRQMEIKIQSADIKSPDQYSRHAVYVTRIAACKNPKFRVIDTEREHVRNCLKVTFNPDRYTVQQIKSLIRARVKLLSQYSHGSCHNFITIDTLSQVITGVNYFNGEGRKYASLLTV